MKQFRGTSVLTATAVVAGLLGIVIITLSLTLAVDQMWPNLLGVADLLLGVAFAILIVDRVTARQRNRDWRFAHDTIACRLAAAMVDAMRLLSIRSDAGMYEGHRHRFVEFSDLSQFHFNDLDSNIIALATIVEPARYKKIREIELQLSWLIRTLARRLGDTWEPVEDWEIQEARRVGATIMDYVKIESDGATAIVLDEALRLLPEAPARSYSASTIGNLVGTRWEFQDLILSHFSPECRPGIMMDVDLDLALRYFAIDWWLLHRVEPHSDRREALEAR